MTTSASINTYSTGHLATADTTDRSTEDLADGSSASAGARHRGRSTRELRHAKLARKLIFSDVIVICCSVALGQTVRFGAAPGHPIYVSLDASSHIRYLAVSITIAALWMGFLSLGSRSPRVVGRGTDEYVTLVAATLQLFGLVAITETLLHIDLSADIWQSHYPRGSSD